MSTISVRLDSNDKHLFEEFCNDVGMSISTAVSMFVKNVIANQKLPFSVERDPFYSEENKAPGLICLQRRKAAWILRWVP